MNELSKLAVKVTITCNIGSSNALRFDENEVRSQIEQRLERLAFVAPGIEKSHVFEGETVPEKPAPNPCTFWMESVKCEPHYP